MWINWHIAETTYCPPRTEIINGGMKMTQQRRTSPILLFTLECGHISATWANTTETELRCVFHDKPSKITGIHVYEWRARCHHMSGSRCPFSRWNGTSKALAAESANKHARTHPSHAPFIGLEYTVRPDAQAELEKRLANGAFTNR